MGLGYLQHVYRHLARIGQRVFYFLVLAAIVSPSVGEASEFEKVAQADIRHLRQQVNDLLPSGWSLPPKIKTTVLPQNALALEAIRRHRLEILGPERANLHQLAERVLGPTHFEDYANTLELRLSETVLGLACQSTRDLFLASELFEAGAPASRRKHVIAHELVHVAQLKHVPELRNDHIGLKHFSASLEPRQRLTNYLGFRFFSIAFAEAHACFIANHMIPRIIMENFLIPGGLDVGAEYERAWSNRKFSEKLQHRVIAAFTEHDAREWIRGKKGFDLIDASEKTHHALISTAANRPSAKIGAPKKTHRYRRVQARKR